MANLSPFERLQDKAESVGGSVVRADQPMFKEGPARMVPGLIVTLPDGKTTHITRPTFHRCVEDGDFWWNMHYREPKGGAL